jgi:hypothetical protein
MLGSHFFVPGYLQSVVLLSPRIKLLLSKNDDKFDFSPKSNLVFLPMCKGYFLFLLIQNFARKYVPIDNFVIQGILSTDSLILRE